MKLPSIDAPGGQNWSCHGCSNCCRGGLLIVLTPADRQRILDQNWTLAEGVDPARMMEPNGSGFRLGHQPDGACVFLDPDGRCRIHSRFGEPAKPMACRIYPLVFHPAGRRIATGVRFDCPSAVVNRGKPLSAQTESLRPLAALALEGMPVNVPPPSVFNDPSDDWPGFLRFVRRLERIIANDELPLGQRWVAGLHWLSTVERARLDLLHGPEVEGVLDNLLRTAVASSRSSPTDGRPGWTARMMLRQQVLEQARRTTVKDLSRLGRYRWFLVLGAGRFLLGAGTTPNFGSGFTAVPFSAIESMPPPSAGDADPLLTRYFLVKLQSFSFCGVGFHGLSLRDGFRSLALQYAVILWLSRWHAAAAGRPRPNTTDLEQSIQRADHNWSHGRPPLDRLRLLVQRGDLERLCSAGNVPFSP
jgi:lysine-N-methylase